MVYVLLVCAMMVCANQLQAMRTLSWQEQAAIQKTQEQTRNASAQLFDDNHTRQHIILPPLNEHIVLLGENYSLDVSPLTYKKRVALCSLTSCIATATRIKYSDNSQCAVMTHHSCYVNHEHIAGLQILMKKAFNDNISLKSVVSADLFIIAPGNCDDKLLPCISYTRNIYKNWLDMVSSLQVTVEEELLASNNNVTVNTLCYPYAEGTAEPKDASHRDFEIILRKEGKAIILLPTICGRIDLQ